jgi:hypothetical protein
VTELSFRPGGWHQLSVYEHRTRYWGLGTLPVSVNLAAPGEDDRNVDVDFMVFDDSCLPAHSSVEVVLHSAFALQLQEWTQEASAADGVSLSFSQNLSPDPYFNATAIPEDGRDSPAAPAPLPSEMSDAPADLLPDRNAHPTEATGCHAEVTVAPNQLPCLFDPNHPLHARTSRLDPPIGGAGRRAMTATVPELWLDGHNQQGAPAPPGLDGEQVWYFGYAGVIVWLMDDNFDSCIVGNDTPGEGPAGWSGECQYNVIGSTWCEGNGILVDTKSPVPVRYVTDERYLDGIPGHPGVEVSVIGSTNLLVAVDHRAPRTLTFLVVSVNSEIEVNPLVLNYLEFDLESELCWKTSPPQGPAFDVCETAPCGALNKNPLAPIPSQDSIVVAAISTSLVPPPVKRVTRSQSLSTPSDPPPVTRRPSSQDPYTGKTSTSGSGRPPSVPGDLPPNAPVPTFEPQAPTEAGRASAGPSPDPPRPRGRGMTLPDEPPPAAEPPETTTPEPPNAITTSPAASPDSRPARQGESRPPFTGAGLPLSRTTWPVSSAAGVTPPQPGGPAPSQPDSSGTETTTFRTPVQGAATGSDPPPPPGDGPSDDDGGDDDPGPSPPPSPRICRHCRASIALDVTWKEDNSRCPNRTITDSSAQDSSRTLDRSSTAQLDDTLCLTPSPAARGGTIDHDQGLGGVRGSPEERDLAGSAVSPPLQSRFEFVVDEGTLLPARFEALRASTLIKPEKLPSDHDGAGDLRASTSPRAFGTDEASSSVNISSLLPIPTFGGQPPVLSPPFVGTNWQPPMAQDARELRRLDGLGYTVDNPPSSTGAAGGPALRQENAAHLGPEHAVSRLPEVSTASDTSAASERSSLRDPVVSRILPRGELDITPAGAGGVTPRAHFGSHMTTPAAARQTSQHYQTPQSRPNPADSVTLSTGLQPGPDGSVPFSGNATPVTVDGSTEGAGSAAGSGTLVPLYGTAPTMTGHHTPAQPPPRRRALACCVRLCHCLGRTSQRLQHRPARGKAGPSRRQSRQGRQ